MIIIIFSKWPKALTFENFCNFKSNGVAYGQLH